MISLKYLMEGWVTTDLNQAFVHEYARRFYNWADLTAEDALDVAGMYEYDYQDDKKAKAWRKFSADMNKLMKRLNKIQTNNKLKVMVLPPKLHKELESARFHQEPTKEDNYKNILKQATKYVKELEKLK